MSLPVRRAEVKGPMRNAEHRLDSPSAEHIQGQVPGIQRMVAEPVDASRHPPAARHGQRRYGPGAGCHLPPSPQPLRPDAINPGGNDKVRNIAELADIFDQFFE